ncbi:PaaI family thioesterase [Leuconostocaceae bacterium ESL0723]|nr:PaaI family thioesterase [Leuconostocaceae bacterium ESL0723]
MDITELLGIHAIKISPQETVLELAVTDKVKQPYGLVHGGVNALLAETAASMAAQANLPAGAHAVGIDIETHHLLPVQTGTLVATAHPLRLGKQIQTWTVTLKLKNTEQITSFSTVTTKSQTH